MRLVGLLALYIAAGLSLYVAYAFYIGNKAKAKKGEPHQVSASWFMIWQFATVSISSLVLLLAFVNNDFTFGYVAEHSSVQMSTFYKISAFWAGHEGSLLLWLWMLAGYTAVLAYLNIKKTDRLKSLALYVSNFVQFFLMFVMFTASNPFKAVDPQIAGTATGMGLNPLLQHWAMVLHPPTLFMGYAGLTIPFAFAIAALIDRNASTDWVKGARTWTLFAWLFLTIGIFLGALWAYVVLGWGGYWGWDPVENASILPWLTGTALLHTFTLYRRRGGMKVWAVSLATLSFIMCVMATFITRSGLINSVHAFPDPRIDLTLLFGGLMVGAAGLTWYLVNTRKKEFETQEFFSDFLSRHFTYYLNNLVLVAFTLIILGATIIPPFFKITEGPEFYNRLAKPLGSLYLILLVICPYLGWTKTEGKKLLRQLALPAAVAVVAAVPLYLFGDWFFNYGYASTGMPVDGLTKIFNFIILIVPLFGITAVLQLFYLSAKTRAEGRGVGFLSGLTAMFKYNRGMAGGYIGHLGIAIMMLGIAGSQLYVQDIQRVIKNKPGEVVQAANYDLVYTGMKQTQAPDQDIINAQFQMKDRNNGGKLVDTISPQFIFHQLQQQQTTKAAIHYEPFRDVFVVFNGIDQQGMISLNIKVNPLISFVWIGSFILAFGTVYAMWPRSAAATEEAAEEAETKGKGKAARRRKEALAGAE